MNSKSKPMKFSSKSTSFFAIIVLAFLTVHCGDSSPTAPEETAPPSLNSLEPAEGTVGTELEVAGSNFESGATVSVGEHEADVSDVTSTTIYADVPSGIPSETALDVTVTNPNGESASLSEAFTGIPPVLAFVNSATKPSGNTGSTVIVEGKAFGDSQGDARVLFSDGNEGFIEAVIEDPDDDWTDSFIVTTVPDNAEDGPMVVETPTGTSEQMEFIVTDGAAFSPSSIQWTSTQPLPDPVSGHRAVHTSIAGDNDEVSEYVQVLGGRNLDGENMSQALYGEIDQQGEVMAWSHGSGLPQPISHHAAVSATPFNAPLDGHGYVYVLGGIDNEEDEPVSDVRRGSLNQDGSIGNWSSQRPLPEPLHSLEAVVFRGAVYVAGGAGEGHEPTDRVYRAEIDTDGELGPWQEQASLPSDRAYHGLNTFGGRLYVTGGEQEAVAPGITENQDHTGEVAYARIDLRSGEIDGDGWIINDNEMGKSRSKHSTMAAGGNLFVTSGVYSGQPGSSENIYAQIRSDGSVDEFGGATGENTLQSEGGTNLFNQAVISYVDGDGVARIMVIGGNDVEDPGNRQVDVMYY